MFNLIKNFNINFSLFWGKKTQEKREIRILIDRFYQVFDDHGIAKTEIPRMIPEITLNMLDSDEKLLSVLTSEMIDKISDLFKIKSSWLRGNSSTIYDTDFCYKQPSRFFKKLEELEKKDFDSSLIAITSKKELNYKKNSVQSIRLIFREPIYRVNDKIIYRYHIWGDAWDWGIFKTRLQLKALARITSHKFNSSPIPIYHVTHNVLKKTGNGTLIPNQFIIKSNELSFSLEDFANSYDENRMAKEEDELSFVLEYIESKSLEL